MRQRPELGLLGTRAADLTAEVATAAGVLGGASLSAAELRLAPLLATHLTLKEIGGQLYIAPTP